MVARLNVSLGTSCFTRCVGCYNHFANSLKSDARATAEQLLNFLGAARSRGLAQVTYGGGDPLSHPEFLKIARNSHELGLVVKVDTVGTAFLRDAVTSFYGRIAVPRISIEAIYGIVDVLGLPVDGSTEEINQTFRRASHGVVADSLQSLELAATAGIRTCVNTVAHRGNLGDLPNIWKIIQNTGPTIWQIFEFMPSGKLGWANRNAFTCAEGDFERAISALLPLSGGTGTVVQAKSRSARDGAYLMVDDAGVAWMPPRAGAQRTVVGHIERDREQVLDVLDDRRDLAPSWPAGVELATS